MMVIVLGYYALAMTVILTTVLALATENSKETKRENVYMLGLFLIATILAFK